MTHRLAKYLTVPEFAEKANGGAGVTVRTVYKAIDSGKIKAVLIGKTKMPFIHPLYLKAEFRKPIKSEQKIN